MDDKALRDHVLYLLRGGGAHLSFDDAIADLPDELRGAKAAGAPHTPWRLLEHIRIAQWDNWAAPAGTPSLFADATSRTLSRMGRMTNIVGEVRNERQTRQALACSGSNASVS